MATRMEYRSSWIDPHRRHTPVPKHVRCIHGAQHEAGGPPQRVVPLLPIAMQQAVRDALIAFIAVTAQAQAQAEATKPAQGAGIDHKRRAQPNAYLGRKPSYDRQRSRVSGLRSTAPTRRAYPPSRRPRALASRQPFASNRTRWPERPRWLQAACDGKSACSSRRYASILRRFFSLFLSILNLKNCQADSKKGRLEAARCLGPSVFAPGAPIGCAARMPAAARLTGQVRVSGCQSVAGCLN